MPGHWRPELAEGVSRGSARNWLAHVLEPKLVDGRFDGLGELAGLVALLAAPNHPYAQHNRANDEQYAHKLAARRVIGLPVHDGGGADGDDKHHEQVLHGFPF